MKRDKASRLRSDLLKKGIRLSVTHEDGRSPVYTFASAGRGVVLFTVGMSDLFDAYGNQFQADIRTDAVVTKEPK